MNRRVRRNGGGGWIGRNGGVGWKGGIGKNGGIRKNGGLEKRMGWINGGIGKKVLGVRLEAGI